MRVLFSTMSAYGHLHPLMPLALAAQAAGDDVVVATGADLADWVAACGVPHVTAGRGGSDTWTKEEHEGLAQWGALRPFHLFTTFHVPPKCDDLVEVGRSWKPDLIVHEETDFAGPLAAELLGVPVVTHSYAAPARPVEERHQMLELLGPLWAERTTATPRITGDLYLDACPPAFQQSAAGSIPEVHAVRPTGFDGPPAARPPWLADLARPAAYVTFGTVSAFSRPEVIEPALAALSAELPGLVVTTGPNPVSSIQPPAGTVVERYLRQSLVLGDVDLVVSHGGAGTTLGAIEHGLPHVVMPQMPFSQGRNAATVEALSLGCHVPQGAYDELAPAVRRVLDDGRFRENVGQMRDSLQQLPAPEAVVEQLRALLR